MIRAASGREERHERYERYERTAAGDGVSAAAVRVYRVDGTLPEPERKTHGSAAGLHGAGSSCGKAYSTAKEYCTFSAAAGQIANRLQETDGEEKQFLVFQTEGAEADGMVPEILRAVLDADGKRAHLVTPFLEQLLFAEEADILWQVLLLGDAWHCLDEEWREKVRASFREKTAAPDAWSREWTKSLLQEWAVYVTEDDSCCWPAIRLCCIALI